MKLLGVSPVMMAQADVYTNIQKGVIDGTPANWDSTYSYKVYEVVKYYTYAPLSSTMQTHIMNLEKWNSLPKDIQEQIMSVSGLSGSEFWGNNFFDTVTNIAKPAIQKEGYTMNEYTVPPEELILFCNQDDSNV